MSWPEQGAEQLGDDVRQHVAPREQAVDGLGEGHGRVDVGAGDATEHEHREHDAEAVAHGDVQPAGVVALGVLELNVGHGAVAEDHQNGGAEELGGQLGKERIIHCSFLYCFFSNDSYDSCDWEMNCDSALGGATAHYLTPHGGSNAGFGWSACPKYEKDPSHWLGSCLCPLRDSNPGHAD